MPFTALRAAVTRRCYAGHMDIRYTPSTALDLTELARHTPEWEAAKALVRERQATGGANNDVAAEVADALRPVIDVDDMVAQMVGGAAIPADDAVIVAVTLYLSLHLLAAVLADIEGNMRALVPMATGGVQVVIRREEGIDYPIVIAIATPFTPMTIVDEFETACLQTFKDPIKESDNGERDREWFNRHRTGETYQSIALNDPRSGLAPEARNSPSEYPDEVRSRADVVAKAAQRYKRKWTKVIASLSRESTP